MADDRKAREAYDELAGLVARVLMRTPSNSPRLAEVKADVAAACAKLVALVDELDLPPQERAYRARMWRSIAAKMGPPETTWPAPPDDTRGGN